MCGSVFHLSSHGIHNGVLLLRFFENDEKGLGALNPDFFNDYSLLGLFISVKFRGYHLEHEASCSPNLRKLEGFSLC